MDGLHHEKGDKHWVRVWLVGASTIQPDAVKAR